MMKESTEQLYRQRILQVLIFIQRNLDSELSLDEFARVAHFSPYHFHRVFRGIVGESLQEHLRRLRLERAAMRLKHTDWTVLEIALEACYETHEAFTRAFRALYDCSPSRFRQDKGFVGKASATRVHYREDGSVDKEFQLPVGGEIMEVKIERLEPMYVAFVRHVGPYGQVHEAWEKLCMRLGREGQLGAGARFIGVCYDDPEVTAPERIRYDACVTVGDDFVAADEVGLQTLAGGEYAVVTHTGPYEQLGQTYARLFGQWLPHSGRELRSQPSYEFYLNDPDSTDPADLLTDIYAPLELLR